MNKRQFLTSFATAVLAISRGVFAQVSGVTEHLRDLGPVAQSEREARLEVEIDEFVVSPRAIEATKAGYATWHFRAPQETPAQATQEQQGRGTDAHLAEELQNPIAALISAPFISNFDFGGGPDGKGFRYRLNFQPVIPVSISEDWNLISRTIAPFISQRDMIGTTSQTGLGDTTQSFFFSPKEPTKWGGIIWGAGPAFLLPSATDDLLGQEKWGIGPTAVVVKQTGGWTFGMLANHIWSVAGSDHRDDVSATFLQPVISYTTKTSMTFGLQAESTYDWKLDQWTVPVVASVSQIVRVGKQPISLQLGGKWFAEGPDGTPAWGIRFAIVLLFPN